MLHLVAVAMAVVGLVACGENASDGVTLGAEFQCNQRNEDTTGFLQPICQHIAATFETYPIDPNTLVIEQNLSGAEQTLFDRPELETDDYRFIGLSCCYTGDWAIIEIDTLRVAEFVLGAI
ncbi:MAG: hypothetical protein AB7O24_07480 [Kofleriaceae bacterium]